MYVLFLTLVLCTRGDRDIATSTATFKSEAACLSALHEQLAHVPDDVLVYGFCAPQKVKKVR